MTLINKKKEGKKKKKNKTKQNKTKQREIIEKTTYLPTRNSYILNQELSYRSNNLQTLV